MNTTDAGIRATHDAILNLQIALLGIFEEKERYGHGYPVMAEGIVSEIQRLRKEIDDRIGLSDFVSGSAGGPDWGQESNGVGQHHAELAPQVERAHFG